ncbi:MAG TPA: VIT domain-containing protein [Planctomycetota bacterium]|nr:VIT domain-containing protein [Planctomycetota bacterium]HRR80737.1 VIT domain-containing protein [Planctomycetota bacterium]HRT95540.1 VIT domain-containing protein [Planctomycetota bacterium]
MKRLLIVLAAALVGSAAAAGESLAPALVVRVRPDAPKPEALRITKLTVESRIFGYLAETKMTMTFLNPHERVLEGDLYFPLPEGSTVSGYALDIAGSMVDGVVVEKEKGRTVYEKIVRQGIDPGLVEWTKGNNFKTRVFPIPAKGTRTVRVDYVAELVDKAGSAAYHLPLAFKEKLDEFALRIEVVKGAAEPKATGGPSGLQFSKFQDTYLAESKGKDVALDSDLVVALPDVAKQAVLVEKAPDGQVYFCINEFPAVQAPGDTLRPAPGRVAVLWDASASRAKADHAREFEILIAYLGSLPKTPAIDLIVFRHEAEPPKRLGGVDALLAELKSVVYDGGTQIGSIALPPGDQPDLCLLFTDGISNFGKEEPTGIQCPLYIFNGQATANHAFLRYLALATGGEYFNLAKLDNKAIVPNIGNAAFAFLSATTDGASVEETFPRLTQPVHGRFTLAGKLKGETGKVTLAYGAGGKPSARSVHTVLRSQAVEGNLLRRLWAQKKVADLEVFLKRNESEIVAVGKQYEIVTPYTSLIVLDSLEQYVQHRILPPKSLPKVREQYIEIVEKQRLADEKSKEQKLAAIVALWNERVKWWETEFRYPANFRYKEQETKDEAPARGGAGAPPAEGAPAPAARDPHGARPAAPATTGRPMADADDAPVQGAARGGELLSRLEAKRNGAADERSTAPAIAIKAWDPKTPYIEAIRRAKPDEAFAAYLKQRDEYGTSPAFFLDCANHFLAAKQEATALQVLSNVAELELENAALVRVLAHRLAQLDGLRNLELASMLFEEALRMRPEEPQSWRDLALVLARRADALSKIPYKKRSVDQAERDKAEIAALYSRAIELLYHVVLNTWDRFEQIELIALMELNALLPKAKAAGIEKPNVDPRLVKLLDVDVRIILTWDADNTDMDLHVVEPSGERAFYGHQRTTIGGNVSRDFTQGYGPEEYLLKKAMPGMYTIQANYYGSSAAQLIGAVTLQVDVFTNYGRPNEQRKSLTLRLTEKKETFTVGQIEF